MTMRNVTVTVRSIIVTDRFSYPLTLTRVVEDCKARANEENVVVRLYADDSHLDTFYPDWLLG